MRRGLLSAVMAMGIGLLAACSETAPTPQEPAGGADVAVEVGEGPYTLEMFTSDEERIYLVTDSSDGQRVAARVVAGVSTFMDPMDARGLLTERQQSLAAPAGETEGFAIRAPGFSMSIGADSAEGGDAAAVSITAGGASVDVNASGSGAENERASVRIGGVDAEEARRFITEADDIEPGVQQQMLDTLGL